ncbi:hypothetical protein [Actinomyces howellii]|uniref:Uncharacterized protein n=1 Tax=Actinomyces howellii TaxID=52771 RepID=A0A3S4R0T4_9ACTO|nr:hypothetical protein [Actinomyces howellii]VEG28011.1 Uncharacterised protein [Actinomyces howellii]
MMRPIRRKPAGEWAGTVQAVGRGMCAACYEAVKRNAKSRGEAVSAVPSSALAGATIDTEARPRASFVWQWPMVCPGVPSQHLEIEAMADLMDHLEAMGWLLSRSPQRLSRPAGGGMAWLVHVEEAPLELRRALEARPETATIPTMRGSLVFARALLMEGVSIGHMEADIVADAAAKMRELGLIAIGRPVREGITHGLAPVMRVRIPVRQATPAEASALGHASADVDVVVPVASGEGVAA